MRPISRWASTATAVVLAIILGPPLAHMGLLETTMFALVAGVLVYQGTGIAGGNK